MYKKMASVVMLIGGALANALAFTGSSYLFHRLSKDSIDAERKRHDVVIEKLQAAKSSGHIYIKNELISSIISSGWKEKQKPNSQS